MGNLRISGLVAAAVALGWASQAVRPLQVRAAAAPDKAVAVKSEEKAAAPAAPDSGLSVSRSALCTGVKDREPVDPDSKGEFPASAKSLFFWTEVQAKNPPTSIQHVWYAGGEKVVAVTLSAKNPRTRTWSEQHIWAGDWRVEAVDASGAVLAEARFKVVP